MRTIWTKTEVGSFVGTCAIDSILRMLVGVQEVSSDITRLMDQAIQDSLLEEVVSPPKSEESSDKVSCEEDPL